MSIIKDLVIGGEPEIESFSNILKEDMIEASERSDVEFINKVIVPILKAEEMVAVTISTIEEEKLKSSIGSHLKPIYADTESSTAQAKDNFFLNTNILNKK